jgi:hypothetical protein
MEHLLLFKFVGVKKSFSSKKFMKKKTKNISNVFHYPELISFSDFELARLNLHEKLKKEIENEEAEKNEKIEYGEKIEINDVEKKIIEEIEDEENKQIKLIKNKLKLIKKLDEIIEEKENELIGRFSVGVHSRKPYEILQLINNNMFNTTKLDIFSR